MKLSSKFTTRNARNADATAPDTSSEKRSHEHHPPSPPPSPAAQNLAMAHHIHRLIERAVITDYTQAARMLGVSQPRMTHVMGLLLLAPSIQEAILLGEVKPKAVRWPYLVPGQRRWRRRPWLL